MKLIYKSLFLMAICGFFTIPLMAQTSGGPDDFGYEWKNSDDPDGPAFEWIDITGTGTEVMGLSDDNGITDISMGMDFDYYWLNYNSVSIGSNGWISFNDVANVASCFPDLPRPDAFNNLLAPLMSDLNFDGNGNNAQIFYQNDGAGKFIVSYIDVPFWVNADPMYEGSNTFQVVLNSQDSSITFNYLDVMSGERNQSDNCDFDVVIGMENVNGSFGLKVLQEFIPEDSTSIRFYYPEVVTAEVVDLEVKWNMNDANGGMFFRPTDEIPVSIGVTNNGNVATDDVINVLGQITGGYNSLGTYTEPILPGETGVVSLEPYNEAGEMAAPGSYSFTGLVNITGDAELSNNSNTSEIVVVDMSDSAGVELSYSIAETTTTQVSWSGGGGNSGMANYIESPFYPVTINAVEVFVFGDADGIDDAFTIQIYDASGTNGAPGNLLGIQAIEAGSYLSTGEWVNVELDFPVTFDNGGFYVAWVMQGNTQGIGTDASGAISRRTYEYVGGSFAPYRSGSENDIMMKVIVANPDFMTDVDNVELGNGVAVFPNPTTDKVTIANQLAEDAITGVQVFNSLGQLVISKNLTVAPGDNYFLDMDHLSTGVYYINIDADGARTTKKVSLIK